MSLASGLEWRYLFVGERLQLKDRSYGRRSRRLPRPAAKGELATDTDQAQGHHSPLAEWKGSVRRRCRQHTGTLRSWACSPRVRVWESAVNSYNPSSSAPTNPHSIAIMRDVAIPKGTEGKDTHAYAPEEIVKMMAVLEKTE
jgi:hypothetical protein